jgi:hypothetical protein
MLSNKKIKYIPTQKKSISDRIGEDYKKETFFGPRPLIPSVHPLRRIRIYSPTRYIAPVMPVIINQKYPFECMTCDPDYKKCYDCQKK